MTGVTRRSHPRFPLFADVLVIPKDGTHERFWAATENISMGGMFLRASHALPVDTELVAKIVPPESPAVHATARVIHIKEGQGFGCCIVELAPHSGKRLAHWLGRSGGLLPVAGTIEN